MFLSNHLQRLDLSTLAAAVVTILSAQAKSKPYDFKDEKTGEQRSGVTTGQAAKLEVNGFAYPFRVRLEDGQAAWPVGEYVLDLAAHAPGQQGKHHAFQVSGSGGVEARPGQGVR